MEHLDQAGGGDPSRSFPRDLDSEDQDAAMLQAEDRDETLHAVEDPPIEDSPANAGIDLADAGRLLGLDGFPRQRGDRKDE